MLIYNMEKQAFFYQAMLESTAILSGGFQLRESINLTCYCFIKKHVHVNIELEGDEDSSAIAIMDI